MLTISESLRWEPPLLTITRVATRDAELAGVRIPAGATVMPMLGAANRDETRYPTPDPNRFGLLRKPLGERTEPYAGLRSPANRTMHTSTRARGR